MERELLKNHRAFAFYNRRRLDQLFSHLSEQDACILKAIPFLLQVNMKGLPGYIDFAGVPCGIHNFSWNQKQQKAVTRLFPDLCLAHVSSACLFPRRSVIVTLALIGSAGSIAQTEKSDFDFWVCIEERALNDSARARFEEKLRQIEQWILEVSQTETHFFITDIQRARKNDFGEAGPESSGTAQGKLLKEEFYRTTIVVAGRIPLWWIAPPTADDQTYEKVKEAVASSTELDPRDYVDLGNLSEITWDEFFGASLWQMNKAMASPFKSVLKMAFLEACMDPETGSGPLCDDLKQRVFSLTASDRDMDPYLLLLDYILEYYQKKNRPDVVDLLRTCFYIKVGAGLSALDFPGELSNRKGKILAEYVKSWGWSPARVETLNRYANWPFEKTLTFGKEVHQFMLSTYQILSDRLKQKPELTAKISSRDLTLLGRKLAGLYSKKPGKIEMIKRAVEEGLELEALTLYTTFESASKPGEWRVYRGLVTKEELVRERGEELFLKRSRNLLETLIWLAQNRLYTPCTTFHMIANGSEVSLADVNEVVQEMCDFFPPTDLTELPENDLLDDSRVLKLLVVANFNAPRWSPQPADICLLYRTSWGEQFCESYPTPRKGLQRVQKLVLEISSSNPGSEFYKIFAPKGEGRKSVVTGLEEFIKRQIPKLYAVN